MQHIYILSTYFILQFEYVPDKLSEVCGSTFPHQQTTLMPTTFNGVHKTLEMKQCQDNFGQPVFITNATYTAGKYILNLSQQEIKMYFDFLEYYNT